jgi:signal recognition particle GTPase
MAVVQSDIKADLLALYNSAKQNKMSEEDFADQMATIIRDAILSADVNVTSVSAVQPGTGTSGPGSGSLS